MATTPSAEKVPFSEPNPEIPKPTPYVAGRGYDSVFFLFSPLLGLVLCLAMFRIDSGPRGTAVYARYVDWVYISIAGAVITQTHIFLVFFRSHLNPGIFSQYRFRFTIIPALVLSVMLANDFALITGIVLASFWDIYHASKQTFGIARLYDARSGNDEARGRTLDVWLNHLLYIGPLLAGINLLPSLQPLGKYEGRAPFLEAIPAHARAHHGQIARVIIASGLLFFVYYLFSYWKMAREGYRISRPKVILLACTGATSLISWGFLPFLVASLVANFFHAMQYFGIVWWAEKNGFLKRLKLSGRAYGPAVGVFVMFGASVTYGAIYSWGNFGAMRTIRWMSALTNVLSLMHFWYDGFIWSIRKRQIA